MDRLTQTTYALFFSQISPLYKFKTPILITQLLFKGFNRSISVHRSWVTDFETRVPSIPIDPKCVRSGEFRIIPLKEMQSGLFIGYFDLDTDLAHSRVCRHACERDRSAAAPVNAL